MASVDCRVGKRVTRDFPLDTRHSAHDPDRAFVSDFVPYWTKVQYTALPLCARNSSNHRK